MTAKGTFLRVLDPSPEEKGSRLRELVRRLQLGETRDPVEEDTYFTDPEEFGAIPGSPFAYWIEDAVRRVFLELPALEGNVGTAKVGLQTSDDFRFLRLWWEVDPQKIGFSNEDTVRGRGWMNIAKGGSYSPYYADVHLVVNWFDHGAEIKNFYKPSGRLASRPQNEDFYFRPGLTWPLRTDGLSFRCFPEGCVFSNKGPVIFVEGDDHKRLLALLGVLNSTSIKRLVAVQLARTELAQSYEVGLVGSTPILVGLEEDLASLAERGHAARRTAFLYNEITHVFVRPVLLPCDDEWSLAEAMMRAKKRFEEAEQDLQSVQHELNVEVATQYGLQPKSDTIMRTNPKPTGGILHDSEPQEEDELPERAVEWVAALLQWAVGVAFGRWDIRSANAPESPSGHAGPFDRLPVLPPGALMGREAPIDIAWGGILVDDPEHEWDLVRRIREVLEFVFGDRAQTVEMEALDVLRSGGRTPRTLRDWFRNQKASELGRNFFDFHIGRYSKSRRKAPIYWRLCTSPGRGQSEYGIWLYYPRLTDDTLWTVLNEYVGPKCQLEERRLEELRDRVASADGAERRQAESDIEEKELLLEELRWFESELRKVAERGYAPDLDDGVVINMAPLHSVIPWKEPEKIWTRLEEEEYDWSKLAMQYWPDRVRQKCSEDPSLAIAHGLAEEV